MATSSKASRPLEREGYCNYGTAYMMLGSFEPPTSRWFSRSPRRVQRHLSDVQNFAENVRNDSHLTPIWLVWWIIRRFQRPH